MRLRSFAFVLVLLLTAAPVLGVVCEMDCDQPPATSGCHTSALSHDGLAVRAAQHGCDHDHTGRSPALLTGASARDGVGTFIGLSVATLVHVSVTDARVALVAMHGPPGLSGRRSPSHTSVLRI